MFIYENISNQIKYNPTTYIEIILKIKIFHIPVPSMCCVWINQEKKLIQAKNYTQKTTHSQNNSQKKSKPLDSCIIFIPQKMKNQKAFQFYTFNLVFLSNQKKNRSILIWISFQNIEGCLARRSWRNWHWIRYNRIEWTTGLLCVGLKWPKCNRLGWPFS